MHGKRLTHTQTHRLRILKDGVEAIKAKWKKVSYLWWEKHAWTRKSGGWSSVKIQINGLVFFRGKIVACDPDNFTFCFLDICAHKQITNQNTSSFYPWYPWYPFVTAAKRLVLG